jgi:hypothetical protein
MISVNIERPHNTLHDTPENNVSNHELKKDMVKKTLIRIKIVKRIHYKKFVKNNKIDLVSKIVLTLINAITISILVLDTQGYNFSMIGVMTSSISTLVTALLSVVNFSDKKNAHKNTFRELTDLYRSVTEKVLKNGLSSGDYDKILAEMNSILGVIDDNSPPISDNFSK